MRGNDPRLAITRIPCEILSVDYLLGGGFARGRHSEIYGGYSVGKTYTTYRLIASAQRRGHRCAFVDVEGTFDPQFATSSGVDINSLQYHQQEHGNRVIDFIETLLRGGTFGVIVMDSIAALLPKSELENDMEAGSYGTQQAKLMSAALRKLTAANSSTCLVYINQMRDNIGTVFGKRSVTSGGRAMSFYAGTRLEMVRTEQIKRKAKLVDHNKGGVKDQEIVKGHRVLVRIDKDKTGGTHMGAQSTFVFDYDSANVDKIEDLIYLGQVYELVHMKGAYWYVVDYEDERQNGRKRFKTWLKKSKVVQEDLEEKIKERIYG